jgi:hypothetical protein
MIYIFEKYINGNRWFVLSRSVECTSFSMKFYSKSIAVYHAKIILD